MSWGQDLTAALARRGYIFWTGVPCSYLASLFAAFAEHPDKYAPALREDAACGMAAGAYLSNRLPVVAMQNSGFAAASNAVASLLIPYRVPALLVVSWRGREGQDSQEHDVMGRAFGEISRALGLSSCALEADASATIERASAVALERQAPVIVTVDKGST